MSISKSHALEFQRETSQTKLILSRIPNEHLDYKPHPKSMSMQQLVSHIVELHNWTRLVIERDAFNFHTDYQPTNYNSIEEAIAALDQQLVDIAPLFDTLSDEEWMKPWKLAAGEHVITETPKAGALRFIIENHMYHHRGQLSVYLRLLDLPVPGLYGPSADDQQQA